MSLGFRVQGFGFRVYDWLVPQPSCKGFMSLGFGVWGSQTPTGWQIRGCGGGGRQTSLRSLAPTRRSRAKGLGFRA